MGLPHFRLQTLFMAVLLVASALVGIDSAMTHRRERQLLEVVDKLQHDA